MADKARTPDWSLLPPELLVQIARNHLPNLPDLLRFRSVCTAWRSAVNPTDLISPQLPWLLLPYPHKPSSLSFFNLADQRTYTLPLPNPTSPKTVFGSAHGYLIIFEQSHNEEEEEEEEGEYGDYGFDVSIYNPITKSLIAFPTLLPSVKSPSMLTPCIRKAVLHTDPLLVAVLVHKKLAFCLLGDDEWTVFDVGLYYGAPELAYHNGWLYLVGHSQLQLFGLDGSTALCFQMMYELKGYSSANLVKSEGDLLILQNYEDGQKFDAFKLDWAKNILDLESVGDRLFFVSRRQSLCISRKGLEGWKEKCGCLVSEEFMQAMPPLVYLMSAKDGRTIERNEHYWTAPCMDWVDWRDMMKVTWFLPKIYY